MGKWSFWFIKLAPNRHFGTFRQNLQFFIFSVFPVCAIFCTHRAQLCVFSHFQIFKFFSFSRFCNFLHPGTGPCFVFFKFSIFLSCFPFFACRWTSFRSVVGMLDSAGKSLAGRPAQNINTRRPGGRRKTSTITSREAGG